MNRRLVILGNGFDLNLGLPTAYKDFIRSEECKTLSTNPYNYLTSRIINNYRLNDWIDLEEELKSFAKERNGRVNNFANKFESEYNCIVEQLKNYLNRISRNINSYINKKSIAADLLRAINKSPDDYDIFSFNYTDLNLINKALGLSKQLQYRHIHGSLNDDSIIVGFEDNTEKVEDFCYMIKTFNPIYSSQHLRYALADANEIIFFGHSLGSTDYHYFARFFEDRSHSDLSRSNSTKITFITANDKSHISILERLRNMNNLNTNVLFDQNDIEFLYSSDKRIKSKLYYFVQRLILESEADAILNEK